MLEGMYLMNRLPDFPIDRRLAAQLMARIQAFYPHSAASWIVGRMLKPSIWLILLSGNLENYSPNRNLTRS